MEGRWWVGIFTLAVPAVLIGITVAFFSLNPLAIFGLLAVITAGVVYLLSYTESPGLDSTAEAHW